MIPARLAFDRRTASTPPPAPPTRGGGKKARTLTSPCGRGQGSERCESNASPLGVRGRPPINAAYFPTSLLARGEPSRWRWFSMFRNSLSRFGASTRWPCGGWAGLLRCARDDVATVETVTFGQALRSAEAPQANPLTENPPPDERLGSPQMTDSAVAGRGSFGRDGSVIISMRPVIWPPSST